MKKRKFGKYFILILFILILSGCSNKEYKTSINVLNWSSYIPDSVIRDFENKYKIEVNYSTYSSNEELLAKVSNVKSGTYDLVFPSDYMVSVMKKKGLLEKIDKERLSYYDQIDDKYLGLDYDTNNQYSVPFLAASVVLVVNRDIISDDISSFRDLLKEEYKDQVVLIDDTRIIIGQALMALGYDMNSTNEKELEEAKNLLLEMKDNIKAFDSDSPKSFLITKEASLGLMWSAESLLAKNENPNMEIIFPEEGYAVSIDNFAIMKDSSNLDEVYLFINYILSRDVMYQIVMDYPYSSVNEQTNKKIGYHSIYREDYQMILEDIMNGKRVQNIGKYISLYDKVWAYIK